MAIIRDLAAGDLPAIAATQGGAAWHGTWDHWPRYLDEHLRGERWVAVVEESAAIIGYGSLVWRSQYPPFAETGVPEVQDMVVAEDHRGGGHGNGMLTAFEDRARAAGCAHIGIGFGLYGDYGRAQRLYVRRGFVPDGRGVTYDNQPGVPGQSYRLDDDLVLWLIKPLR